MGYNDRGPNDWITNAEIQDAINNGLIQLNAGQSVTTNNNWITTNEANTKLRIVPIGGGGTNWITKALIQAILNIACGTEFQYNSGLDQYSETVDIGTLSGIIEIDCNITYTNNQRHIRIYAEYQNVSRLVYEYVGSAPTETFTTKIIYSYVHNTSTSLKITVAKSIVI